jgi:RNA polymerase sigma-70 factor (ECF subfamily)
MDDLDSGGTRGVYDEHAAALSRYVQLLTGDRGQAANVVAETLWRARQHPDVAEMPVPSARAWLFTDARNTIIDNQRSAGLSNDTGSPDSLWRDGATPEEVNAAVDRLLLGDALAQLPANHRAAIRCAYYQHRTTTQIAADLHIEEATVKPILHGAMRALQLRLRAVGVALQ